MAKTQVTRNEPWEEQEDYLMGSLKARYTPQQLGLNTVQGLFPRAYDVSQTPQQFYPGQTFAPWSTATQQAQDRLWGWGQNPSQIERSANRQLVGTMGGQYLSPQNLQSVLGVGFPGGSFQNTLMDAQRSQSDLRDFAANSGWGTPGFNAAYQAASDQITPQVAAQFGGRANSSGFGLNLAESLGRAFAGLYGDEQSRKLAGLGAAADVGSSTAQLGLGYANANAGLYGQERGRQLLAASQAPVMQAMERERINAMLESGLARDAEQQKYYDENVARWNFNQAAPRENLSWLSSILNMGTPYSQATTSVPNSGGSKAASILGGGLAGAGIGSMLPATALGGFGLPIAVGAGLLSGFLK